jgi:hypothetical protein
VRHGDPTVLKQLAEAGQLSPLIDRQYPLSEVADALRYVGTRQVRGKLVIQHRSQTEPVARCEADCSGRLGRGQGMEPRARRQGLVIRKVSDEVVVYDTVRHVAHCLNPSAALVFQRADGTTSSVGLAASLRQAVDARADERWVDLALDELRRAHLLEEDPTGSPAHPCVSRRLLLRRAGLGAALLLPLVASLLAPTPAEAVATGCVTDCTGKSVGTPCTLAGDGSDCDFYACDGLGNCV